MTMFRIETSAIASLTLFVEADTEAAAVHRAREASNAGPSELRRFLQDADTDTEIESLDLDSSFVEATED